MSARSWLWRLIPSLLPFVVGCQDSTNPGFVDAVRLFPDSAHIPLGETFEFRVLVLDQRGDSLPERIERVSITNRNPGVVTSEVSNAHLLVTPIAPGSATLEAQLGFGKGAAMVFVPPDRVSRIVIDPSPVLVANNGQASVQARLFNLSDQEMEPAGHRISWRVVNATLSVSDPGPTATLHAPSFATLPRTDTLVLVVDDLLMKAVITVR